MNLTFLTPLVLAGGALFVAVPILIHLIMKRKPKPLRFPAFRFLQQRHKTNVHKLRLRHLLLLALRIGLIVLACLGLSRPELTGGPGELTAGAKIGVVLVFDTSASMAYEHNGKPLLETAKDLAGQLLKQLAPGSKVAVLDTAEPGGQPVDAAQAETLIKSRQIQAANRPLTDGLKEAFRLLEQDKARATAAETSLADLPLILVAFSDRTPASWNQDAATASLIPAKKRLEERLGRPLPCVYLDLSPAQPQNLAITGVSLRGGGDTATPLENLPFGVPAGAEVRLQATVQITGATVDSEVLLFLDGRQVRSQRLKAAVPPGQTATEVVQFGPVKLTETVHQGEVRLKGHDALEADNSRFWTLVVVRRQVLVIADRPDDAAAWVNALEVNPLLPVTCKVVTPAEAPEALFPDQYQTVCLLNVAQPAPELWDRLSTYVVAGGGLIVLPGEDSLPAAYNTDQARKVMPAKLLAKVNVPRPGGTLVPASYDHAIMAPFKLWERHNPPGRVYRFWDLERDPKVGAVIVPYNDGKPALVERAFDPRQVRGRVILFTTAMYRRPQWKPDEDWNSYHEGWMALAMPYLTVRYVLGAREERHNFTLDDEPRFWLPRGPGFASFELTGAATASGEVKQGQAQLLIPQARKAGNYKVTAPGGAWAQAFSANLPPIETVWQPRPADADLEALFGEKSLYTLQAVPDIHQLANAKIGVAPRTELLPYLMIGVLLFLAGENYLANRFYKREPEQG